MPEIAVHICPDAFAETQLAAALIGWQQEHGRHDLPWMVKDPYCRWLSEIMLQQTRVATVIGYYERFLAVFPTVQALAGADESRVMELWAGLGYYARARNLLSCARRIVDDFGGQFPRDVKTLASLPGIGQSTACAIAAACFGVSAPILDANARRVFARLGACSAPAGSAAEKKELWHLAWQWVPDKHADVFNQALMDLGTLVCTAKKPSCRRCPVARWCQALARGIPEEFPRKKVKPQRPEREQSFVLWQKDVAVWLQQRPARGGVWPLLWCPPEIQHPMPGRVLRFVHDFSHYRLKATVYWCHWTQRGDPMEQGRWLCLTQAAKAALPAPFKKLLLSLAEAAPGREDGQAADDEGRFQLRP